MSGDSKEYFELHLWEVILDVPTPPALDTDIVTIRFNIPDPKKLQSHRP
jgi:hypothetical protein